MLPASSFFFHCTREIRRLVDLLLLSAIGRKIL
jgi:hypothetical protein